VPLPFVLDNQGHRLAGLTDAEKAFRNAWGRCCDQDGSELGW